MKPLGVFLLSWITRAAYLAWRPPAFEGYYWELATSLREHGTLALDGIRTARFEPLYPLFVAGARILTHDGIAGVQVLQCGLASIGAVFFYLAARRLAGDRVALIAAILYAIHPLLIRHAADLSTSALITTTVLLFVYVFASIRSMPRAVLAGACLGLVVLTRSVALPLMLLAPALLAAGKKWTYAAALAGSALVVITPMLARDYALAGSLLPPRAGSNLFLGNSDYTAALMPEHSPDILQRYTDQIAANALGSMSIDAPEFGDKADAMLEELAWRHISAHPLETLGLKIRNVWYFLGPFLVPSHLLRPDTTIAFGPGGVVHVERAPLRPLSERVVFTMFSSVVLVAAAVGVRRRKLPRADGILWCILLTFVAVHSVYFPATRYTGPIVPILLFYAALGAEQTFSGVARVHK